MILKKFFYIENYGCQMNVSDSEIITSILYKNGFIFSNNLEKVNVILFNSCSIREKAELTIKKRLEQLQFLRKKNKVVFGIIGCLLKVTKDALLKEKKIDFFINPHSYKDE